MEFPTTSEEAEKAKREDVMLFRTQKFAPHEADFERIKNIFLSILKDIKKDMDEKGVVSLKRGNSFFGTKKAFGL